MPRTALFVHDDYVHHETGAGHPEGHERYLSIIDAVENSPLQQRVIWRRAEPATTAQIVVNHDPGYVKFLEEACFSGAAQLDKGETCVSHESFHVALLASGAAIGAVDAVMDGSCDNAFCVLRPPGHHAEHAKAMGFCLFNHVAVAARHALSAHGLERVFILDWDAHHGNGTQHSFYADSQVYYCSLHQHPFYPGTGSEDERGMGKGLGTTLNCPLASGTEGMVVRDLMNGKIADAVAAFRPDLILLSAGFDAHRDDPMAHLGLDEEDFRVMTQTVRKLADEHCGGRLVSVLEGGYDIRALAASSLTHMEELLRDD